MHQPIHWRIGTKFRGQFTRQKQSAALIRVKNGKMVSCDLPEVTRSTRQTSSGAPIHRHLLINNIQDPPSLLPTHLPLPCHTISYIPSPPHDENTAVLWPPGVQLPQAAVRRTAIGYPDCSEENEREEWGHNGGIVLFSFFSSSSVLVYVSKRGQANDTLINTLHWLTHRSAPD